MGLKASRLFSESFRASNNPKSVIAAFLYGRGRQNDFLKIYLESDVRCDRLVFRMLRDLEHWSDENDKNADFISSAIFRAEQAKIHPDQMLERLLNAFSIEEMKQALEKCIEWHGAENKEGHLWNGKIGVEWLAQIRKMESWDAEVVKHGDRNEEAERLINETARNLVAQMPFGNFLKDVPG